MINKKTKKKKKIVKSVHSVFTNQNTMKKQQDQTNLHRFSTNLNTCQHFVYKRKSSSLLENWIMIPKSKQKLYYRLYWKLLKSQIKFQKIQDSELKTKSNWILKNKKDPFWINIKSSQFISKHHFGYTIYGENVFDFGKTKNNTRLYDYLKFKDYYKL